MQLVLFILASAGLFSTGLSFIQTYRPHRDKPGHCWSELTGPMDKGEERQIPNECMQASCSDDKELLVFTCGIARGPNGASETDYSKPYPDCCPHPI